MSYIGNSVADAEGCVCRMGRVDVVARMVAELVKSRYTLVVTVAFEGLVKMGHYRCGDSSAMASVSASDPRSLHKHPAKPLTF